MTAITKVKKQFCFYTRMHLTELTGYKASDLPSFVDLIKKAPGSSIYHHTHRYLQQHQYLNPEPPNDFAYWVKEVLGEARLGEALASIDTMQFPSIRELRDRIAAVISDYLQQEPSAPKRFAPVGREFYFMKSISFVMPTSYKASDLNEFRDVLKKITVDAIYYHIFEARLRLEKTTNDFSLWFETALGLPGLARKIAQLDPYTYTMEDLRGMIIQLIEKEIRA